MSICREGKLRRPVVEWLQSRRMSPVFEVVTHGYCDIVGVEFAPRTGRLLPPILQLCAIELKLDDVADVLRQAKGNRHYINESWAAMPFERVAKMRTCTLDLFSAAGVGLLAVGGDVNVIISPTPPAEKPTGWMVDRFPHKLWRRKDEWKTRLDKQRFSTSLSPEAQ